MVDQVQERFRLILNHHPVRSIKGSFAIFLLMSRSPWGYFCLRPTRLRKLRGHRPRLQQEGLRLRSVVQSPLLARAMSRSAMCKARAVSTHAAARLSASMSIFTIFIKA